MKMMVLDKKDEWKKHCKKLLEETLETLEAIELENEDKAHIAEEALDVIQVSIGILDKLGEEGLNIKQAVLRHEKKLVKRGWKYKKVIDIKVA